jgi:hypothetical protein
MGLLYGPDWRRLRKIFDPAFTHSAAVARVDGVDDAARHYVKSLPRLAHEATAQGDAKEGKSFSLPVLQAFAKFPYFQTAAAIYGRMTEEEERDLWVVTEKRVALNQYWIGGGRYRVKVVANLFGRGAVQRLREFNREWLDYNARMVQVRRARGDKAPVITYWEEYEKGNMSMLEVSLQSNSRQHCGSNTYGNELQSLQLLHTLDELLMLNLDVITHVITWFILLVADHEQVKQELRDEVAANSDGLAQYVTKTDTHLHRCFVESMRVRPFASTLLPPHLYLNSGPSLILKAE